MDDKSAQEDEILALKSIYEENDIFTYDQAKKIGNFFIKIESPYSTFFTLNFVSEKKTLKVQHLPPIMLEFELPSDYPSVNAPKFTLSCRWLDLINLSKLCKKLDDLWAQNGNTSILFTWISFLTDELFEYLNLNVDEIIINDEKKVNNKNDLDQRAIRQTVSSHLVKNYDKDQNDLKFKTSYFVCNVCFTDKLGADCMKFHNCEHVFCNECMKSYFETQISCGNVKSLICPQEKCDSQALQTQVLNLVGIEMFNRYDSLLLKDSLNNMADIVYCPRANCQCPVIPEESLAQCTQCKNVFCALCRQGYHGVEPCKISNKHLKEICHAYSTGDLDVRNDLIKKYGEKRIKKAIEENSSIELIENTSKQCPQCKSWMQKLDGCNKMTCAKCHCYFCWLCSKTLSKSDPYSHFNSLNSECFEKLFEGVFLNENNEQNEDEDENEDEENDEFDIDELDLLDEEETIRFLN